MTDHKQLQKQQDTAATAAFFDELQRFHGETLAKLLAAADKGRGGWQDPHRVTDAQLADMLVEHLGKGDMRDVANFCMFLWHRGARAETLQMALARFATGYVRRSKPCPLDELPESGEKITVRVWANTNKHGSEEHEDLEFDKGQWEAATEAQRDEALAEFWSNIVDYGYYVLDKEGSGV